MFLCESETHSVVSDSLQPHKLHSPWNSPDQNIGVVAFPFSRGLPNPEIEPGSSALQMDSLPAESQGKPKTFLVGYFSLLLRLKYTFLIGGKLLYDVLVSAIRQHGSAMIIHTSPLS